MRSHGQFDAAKNSAQRTVEGFTPKTVEKHQIIISYFLEYLEGPYCPESLKQPLTLGGICRCLYRNGRAWYMDRQNKPKNLPKIVPNQDTLKLILTHEYRNKQGNLESSILSRYFLPVPSAAAINTRYKNRPHFVYYKYADKYNFYACADPQTSAQKIN